SFSVAWSAPAPVEQPAPFGSAFPRTATPRGSTGEGRRETNTLPLVRPFPRTTPSTPSAELPGPRAPVTTTVHTSPNLPTVRMPAPTAGPVYVATPPPSNVVTPPPTTRRSNPD